MENPLLKKIGLSENEVKIYTTLLKTGSSTPYEIGKKTGIYRSQIYDILEKLINKGLVSYVYQGPKKYFQAASPEKIKDFLEDKKRLLEDQKKELDQIMPGLMKIPELQRMDTKVEVFRGKEGLKYFLKDIIKTGKEVLMTGIDDKKYKEELPFFMEQYFRELRRLGIKERVITVKRSGIFLFNKKTAPTTEYRFLEERQFNPTNTVVYGSKVVIVSWGSTETAIMIENEEIAETYRNYFEHLWRIAEKKITTSF